MSAVLHHLSIKQPLYVQRYVGNQYRLSYLESSLVTSDWHGSIPSRPTITPPYLTVSTVLCFVELIRLPQVLMTPSVDDGAVLPLTCFLSPMSNPTILSQQFVIFHAKRHIRHRSYSCLLLTYVSVCWRMSTYVDVHRFYLFSSFSTQLPAVGHQILSSWAWLSSWLVHVIISSPIPDSTLCRQIL